MSVFFLYGSLLAQQGDPKMKLYVAKVELSGEVKLVWTIPMGFPAGSSYELYRAKVSDSSSFTLVGTTDELFYVDKVPTAITVIADSYAYYVVAKNGMMTEQSNTVVLPISGIPTIGSFQAEGKVDDGKVKLSWENVPVNTPVLYFLVYRGRLGDGTPLHVKIDSTTGFSSTTNVPQNIPMGSSATFVYYVKAVFAVGDPLFSTSVQITIRNWMDEDKVQFLSRPPLAGQAGVPYVYTASARSSDSNAVIRYYAARPVGLKIDSVTGVVDWTPPVKGWYEVRLFAKSSTGGYAKQEYYVGVAGGNGIIQGKITDTLNAGIKNVVVEVFKTERNAVNSFSYATRTDDNGNYRISRIDPGSYKLRATAPSTRYESQWYDGVHEVQQATIVSVSDSPAVTIVPFKLRGGPFNLPKVTVSGSVTDTNGVAISGDSSRVVFVRAEFALNFGGGINISPENFRKYFDLNPFNDFRLEGNSEHVFKAHTDSLGMYEVNLVPGAYIAFAKARGYAGEFYDQQSSILSATIVKVTADTTGINFTLAPLPPVVLGEINGSVMDSTKDIGVPARVIAFRDRWRFKEDYRIARTYVVDTDSLGVYSIPNMIPGTYIVMAVPLGSYAPAFYSNDTADVRWKKAATIEVHGNSIDNITIYVHEFGQYVSGFTGVNGSVSSGDASVNGQAGAMVYALHNNEVAGYAFTNAAGKYSIGGLAPGQYSVFVDNLGFNESSVSNVTIGYTPEGDPMTATADFSISSVLRVESDAPVEVQDFTLDQNYPNPFNPSTTISYAIPQPAQVTLKVYNIVGQEVATLVNGYQTSGRYDVTFNASRMASGVYFYRLQTGSFSNIKKMVLLK